MKNQMRQTSIDSWIALDGLRGRQRAVYEILDAQGPMSNLEIAEGLRMPINSITPRTNELVEKGVVKESHRGPSPTTGRTVIFWRVS